MPNAPKASVALTFEMLAMLREAVDSGEYTSTSEVVREALRAWKQRRSLHEMEVGELRALWNEGISSGDSVDSEAVFKRLSDKYARMAAAK